jgi:DNA-binding CsgD family transcriptional regulator
LLSDEAWAAIGRSLKLSGRELQILRGMFDDRIEYAIAVDLGISRRTVHTHVERLHRKLGVANRAQLLMRILEEFLALTAAPNSALPPICHVSTVGRCPLGL